jgi:hypothetical protein
VTKFHYEAEELEDGRVRIQIPGEPPFYLKEVTGDTLKARQREVDAAVQVQRARIELRRVLSAQVEQEFEKLEGTAPPPLLAEAVISFLAPKNTVQSARRPSRDFSEKR